MKRFHFSIRTLLLIIISVLNILIAAPLGYMTYQSLVNYRNAQNIKETSEIINYLYSTKKYLSLERASSLAILYMPSSIKTLTEDLEKDRSQADELFEKALMLSEIKYKKRSEHLVTLETVKEHYTNLKILRRSLDRALAMPKDKRDPQLSKRIFDDITKLGESVDDLINSYSRNAFFFNASITRQMRFTRFIWEITEYTGRQYALLGQMIAQNEYPDPEMQKQIIVWRNRIEYGLELAHGNLQSMQLKDEIQPYLNEATTHYFITFEQIEDLFEKSSQPRDKVVYPITVEMWLEMASQVVDSLADLTDSVLNVNSHNVAKIEDEAETWIIISVVLFASAIALSLYIWWLITNRVIRPVNSMVEALYSETKLSNQIMPAQVNVDEIAKLGQVLKVFQDNSRQLQLERDKAQAASVAKSEFLANMSHEIRTPMNVIAGITSILATSTPNAEKQEKFIKTLQVSTDSMLALVNDLLDFSKIEMQSFELEKIPFNLGALCEDVVVLMLVKAKEKGVSFNVDVSAVASKKFIGDPTRIRQILMNLCGNAVKFTEEGSVMLYIGSRPGTKQGYEDIHISVTDTGIGIAADKIDFIFEKFTQADSSISRKYGGTGLGLSITKNLVEMMDGEISVSSTPGEGAVFEVVLPLLKIAEIYSVPPEPSLKPVRPVRTQSDKSTILLVEDYHPNVVVAGTFLEQFGYDYDVAENGHEALQKYMEHHYDVVIMDVQMPGMDGYQATEAIRAYEKKNKRPPVKIIGMTAHASAKDRDKCLESGMNDYLAKPFDPRSLEKALQQNAT